MSAQEEPGTPAFEKPSRHDLAAESRLCPCQCAPVTSPADGFGLARASSSSRPVTLSVGRARLAPRKIVSVIPTSGRISPPLSTHTLEGAALTYMAPARPERRPEQIAPRGVRTANARAGQKKWRPTLIAGQEANANNTFESSLGFESGKAARISISFPPVRQVPRWLDREPDTVEATWPFGSPPFLEAASSDGEFPRVEQIPSPSRLQAPENAGVFWRMSPSGSMTRFPAGANRQPRCGRQNREDGAHGAGNWFSRGAPERLRPRVACRTRSAGGERGRTSRLEAPISGS